jgi:hypothetical protein
MLERFHYLTALNFLVCRVPVKRTGRGELAELMTNHVLRDENGDKLAAIVDSECEPNHLGDDHGASAPGFDGASVSGFLSLIQLSAQAIVNPRSFLN